MNEFLQKLIKHDSIKPEFATDNQIIQQGLAPLYLSPSSSIQLQKANLLEKAKLENWKTQANLLFEKLNDQNIQFLVFKGFAFTFLLYKETHLRPYSDIDIIINKPDYKKVNDILNKLNYQQYPSRQGQFVSFQNSFYDNNTPQTVIDLHWQINNRIEFHKHFNFTDLYKSAFVLNNKELSFKTLHPVDGFILGCFHYQAHRPSDRKHIWLYDLALMWKRMTPEEKESCLIKAKKTQQSNIVRSTLSLLNSSFVDCFQFDFKQPIKSNEATQSYLNKRTSKISDIKTRLQNINGSKNKMIFLSEYLFQSRDYVQKRYNIRSTILTMLYYPRMWVEDIFKLFK